MFYIIFNGLTITRDIYTKRGIYFIDYPLVLLQENNMEKPIDGTERKKKPSRRSGCVCLHIQLCKHSRGHQPSFLLARDKKTQGKFRYKSLPHGTFFSFVGNAEGQVEFYWNNFSFLRLDQYLAQRRSA